MGKLRENEECELLIGEETDGRRGRRGGMSMALNIVPRSDLIAERNTNKLNGKYVIFELSHLRVVGGHRGHGMAFPSFEGRG